MPKAEYKRALSIFAQAIHRVDAALSEETQVVLQQKGRSAGVLQCIVSLLRSDSHLLAGICQSGLSSGKDHLPKFHNADEGCLEILAAPP